MLHVCGGSVKSSRKLRSMVLAGAAFVGTMAPARTILAAPNELRDDERRMQAQTLFEEGTKKADTNPRAALVAFRAAFDVQPDFHVLYNIGYLYLRVADAQNAIRAYERYLRDGGDKVPPKRRREVDLQLQRLRSNVGKLTLGASAKDLDVRVDGVVVGRTPLGRTLTLGAGSHKVTLAPAGATTPTAQRAVMVVAGGAVTVDFEEPKPAPSIVAIPAPAPVDVAASSSPSADDESAGPPVSAPPPPPADAGGVPIAPWVITGALAAGTGAAAYLTLNANAQYARLRNSFPITRQDLDQAQGKTQSLLTTTMVVGGATLFAAAIATYLTFSAPTEAPRDDRRRVALGPGPGLAGVSLHGTLP
jgi:hypothetical protein